MEVGKGKLCPFVLLHELMEISSHQQTHVHVDKTSPVARVNVIHQCVVVELENGDQLYLHVSNEAIKQIAAKATEEWES